jgi:hypothetical protein
VVAGAVVEDVRVLVHLGADAVAAVVLDQAVPVGDEVLDGGADRVQPLAGHHRADPAQSAFSVTSTRSWSPARPRRRSS